MCLSTPQGGSVADAGFTGGGLAGDRGAADEVHARLPPLQGRRDRVPEVGPAQAGGQDGRARASMQVGCGRLAFFCGISWVSLSSCGGVWFSCCRALSCRQQQGALNQSSPRESGRAASVFCVGEVLCWCSLGCWCRGCTRRTVQETTPRVLTPWTPSRPPPPPPISLASLTKPVPGRPRKRRPTWRESWKSPPGWPKGGDGRGGNDTEKTEAAAAAAAAPGMGCPGAPTLQSPRRGGRRRG